MARTWKLYEGVTVTELGGGALFRYPQIFDYKIIETGETFAGYSGYYLEDYLEWKPEERVRFPEYCQSQKAFHVEPFATVIQTPHPGCPNYYRYKVI